MVGIAMAAHQSEESDASYSYADIKISGSATEKNVNLKAHHKHSASFSSTQQRAPNSTSPTLSAFTPKTAVLTTTISAAYSETTHIPRVGQGANGFNNGSTNLHGRSTQHGLSRTFAADQNQGHLMQSGKRMAKSAVPGALTPLINAQIYGKGDRSNGPIAAYHEQQMRKSMHRLVSATTRFDKVTTGALSFLSDIARLYLQRIGEACRARTDLAGRTEPNLCDMLESTTFDLGMDWASIGAWVDEWKAEVGDVIVQEATASTNAPVYTSLLKESGKLTSAVSDPENSDEQTQTRRNSLAIGQVLPTNVAARDVDKVLTSMRRMSVDGTVEPILGSEATCNGSGDRIDVEVDSEMFGDDGLDEMLDGLNLGCLLLDEADMADGTQAITMPHLPPLVVPTEDDEKEQDSNQEGTGADAGATGIAGPAVVVAAAPGSTSENLSTVAKEMLGSGSTNDNNALDSEGDAEDSPESVMAQLLHLTTASLASLHPSIVSDKPLYAFFRPAAKFDATCAPDDILPDFDIPEIAYTPAPKRIEQLLSQKSHLEPGKPMFITNDTEDRDVIGDSEKMWRQARTSMYQDIFDQAAEHAMDEMDNAPPLMVKKYKDGDDDLGLQESHGSELLILEGEGEGNGEGGDKQERNTSSSMLMQETANIEEDILDLDMGTGIDMDMDMDVDLDLDFDNVLDIVSGNVPNAVTKDSTGDTRDVRDNQDNGDPEVKGGKNDAYPEAEEEDRQLDLPVSSGLRGSGKPHWSNEWFTPAMRKRLTSMTASDVVPFDSLFVTDPWASRRLVVDEVARAFVDSEGGGHLHATTPLEGFGPAANTYTVPNSSGSALRWTLHHIMQSKNTNKVDSLYTGRSSLAGGVSGDGVGQYIGRMCSLIKASVEEEAELVVNGALGINKSKQEAKLKAALDQGEMIEQLVVGADKRIPWAQNRLDIHVIESRIANREPQKADPKQHLLPPPATFAVSRSATPALPASSDHHSADNSSGNQSLRAMSPLHSFSVPERRDSEVDIGGQVVEHNPTPPAQEQEQEQVQETQDQIHKVVEHTEKPLERSQQQELPEQTVEMSEKSEQQRLHYLEEDNDMFI